MKLRSDARSWQPVGVASLEKAADDVVRSSKSTMVVAGPGAGKTELLAQRACYLLQTRACAAPQRILAISFKRDAARNLRDRVNLRCGHELAARFDSYTFDSFSKSLVDRFLCGIPESFRPTADYVLDTQLLEKKTRDLVLAMPSDWCALSDSQRQYLSKQRLWEALINRQLPLDGQWQNASIEDVAASELWIYLLRAQAASIVNFAMIGRLAELLLAANPRIVGALRRSYRFVFLDEYQDTTRVQYALVRRAFLGSDTVLTAVGDKKQRIMGWAGAMEKAFDVFGADFHAGRVNLLRNYRSTPLLVKIQSVLAKALDQAAVAARSMFEDGSRVDECRVLEFLDDDVEADYLAKLIHKWVVVDGLKPRDVCVLCRMKEADYAGKLVDRLSALGIRARLEKLLQDLLAEPLTDCLLDVLKLACRPHAADAWANSVALLDGLAVDGSDKQERKRTDGLLAFTRNLSAQLGLTSRDQSGIECALRGIMKFMGEDAFRIAHPQYLQGSFYDQTLHDVAEHLGSALAATGEWSEAIDELEGVDSVPIMTTHKSKGLEYHTIVFVGLEDGALFGFGDIRSPKTIEELCGVFVALSRAKQRALFTYSRRRGSAQSRTQIKPLYDLLKSAGVQVEAIQ